MKERDTWHSLTRGPRSGMVLHAAMAHAARGLTDMVGHTITHDAPQVKNIPVSEMIVRASDLATETVGVYLQIEGGLSGQAMLILPLTFALNLVDLATNAPQGTTTALGRIECSALAEVGNLTLAYFLNAVAETTGRPEILQPSPPAVMVDMLGDILDLVVRPAAALSESPLIVETIFKDVTKSVQFRFWLLPDLKSNGAPLK